MLPVGQPFSYRITASNSPTSFSASDLPDGLTVDPASGLISGTATTAGTFTVALAAINASGIGTATLTLTVTAGTPNVTVGVVGDGVATVDGAAGKVVVRRAGSTDGTLALRYKVTGSARPGVDYKALSGSVTIPAGTTQVKVKIKAFDSGTLDSSRTLKIKLEPPVDDSYTLGASITAKLRIVGKN